MQAELIPSAFYKGLIIAILKDSNKDHKDPSNYRGMTLSSHISKLFETLILNRFQTSGIDSKLSPSYKVASGKVSVPSTLLLSSKRPFRASKRISNLHICGHS